MSPIDYRKPWFRLSLPRAVVDKVALLTFPGEKIHPDAPNHRLTDREFCQPIVRLVDGLGVEHLSYSAVAKGSGNAVVADVPDDQLSSGYVQVRGVIRAVEEPLADQWLRHTILEGRAPRALEQMYLSCDFVISAHAAMELGASLWHLPDLSKLEPALVPEQMGDNTHVISVDDEVTASFQRAPLSVTKLIPFKETEQAEAVNDALLEIQAQVFALLDKYKDQALVANLLPLGTLVSTTVTKTIAEWRSWIVSDSQSYESFFLKKEWFNQANRLASCLFAGCEKVIDAFTSYETALKENL